MSRSAEEFCAFEMSLQTWKVKLPHTLTAEERTGKHGCYDISALQQCTSADFDRIYLLHLNTHLLVCSWTFLAFST